MEDESIWLVFGCLRSRQKYNTENNSGIQAKAKELLSPSGPMLSKSVKVQNPV